MHIDNKQVGFTIKSIRQSLGMTQEEFGDLFSANKSNVSKWESGFTLPNKERLKQIAKIGKITVNELLYSEDSFEINTDKFLLKKFEEYHNRKKEVIKSEIKLLTGSVLGSIGLIKDEDNQDRYERHHDFFANFKNYGIKYINDNYKNHSYKNFLENHPNSDLVDFQVYKEDEWNKTKEVFDEIIENYKSIFTESNSILINKRFTNQINNDLTSIKIKSVEKGVAEHYINKVIQPILDEAANKIKVVNQELSRDKEDTK